MWLNDSLSWSESSDEGRRVWRRTRDTVAGDDGSVLGSIGGCATKIMLTLTLRFPSSIQRPRSLIYLPHTPHPYSRARELFVFRADRGGGSVKSFPLNLKSEFACRWPPRRSDLLKHRQTLPCIFQPHLLKCRPKCTHFIQLSSEFSIAAFAYSFFPQPTIFIEEQKETVKFFYYSSQKSTI